MRHDVVAEILLYRLYDCLINGSHCFSMFDCSSNGNNCFSMLDVFANVCGIC
jgi:hypothetical protein